MLASIGDDGMATFFDQSVSIARRFVAKDGLDSACAPCRRMCSQAKALVCEWEDGAMEVYYRGQRLYEEPAPLPRKSEVEASAKLPSLTWPRKNHYSLPETKPIDIKRKHMMVWLGTHLLPNDVISAKTQVSPGDRGDIGNDTALACRLFQNTFSQIGKPGH
jgi:hypothetical protein